MDYKVSWIGNSMSPIGFGTFWLWVEIEQYVRIQYKVGFSIVSNKLGRVTAINSFLPKCVENWHCD